MAEGPISDNAMATCLWFDGKAEEAARLYCDLFPDSEIVETTRAPGDYPGGNAGDVLTVDFTVLGRPFLGLNGGPEAGFTDAVSFQVFTDTQEETDRYWDALLSVGGEPMMCSWLKDRFGVRWQIVPRVLMEGLRHPDAATRERVFAAMSEMVKIDHAGIEAAIAR
ncbi:VOC family protein [Qipengyuania sphaerica]|uniref:VOC family protein n=1 Tax=Qipengyuania sphaerica TaxID=2867243 RepID=UPI001C87A60A|nr:VOC family protein [Qipengyuania sphaerica]MBX7541015.1 VOC family protein [Qipengyuania sphaerica]